MGWLGWAGLVELKDAELKSLALRVLLSQRGYGGSGKTKGDKKNTTKRRRGRKKGRMALPKKKGPYVPRQSQRRGPPIDSGKYTQG